MSSNIHKRELPIRCMGRSDFGFWYLSGHFTGTLASPTSGRWANRDDQIAECSPRKSPSRQYQIHDEAPRKRRWPGCVEADRHSISTLVCQDTNHSLAFIGNKDISNLLNHDPSQLCAMNMTPLDCSSGGCRSPTNQSSSISSISESYLYDRTLVVMPASYS
jgi:hypothetical protein